MPFIIVHETVENVVRSRFNIKKQRQIGFNVSWKLSLNLCSRNGLDGGLFRGSFWGGWGRKITPCLKLVRIMLETWNLIRKFTRTCTFRNYTFQYQGPLNFSDISIFFAKNKPFLAKLAPLLKAIVRELCKRFFSSVCGFCKIKSYCW